MATCEWTPLYEHNEQEKEMNEGAPAANTTDDKQQPRQHNDSKQAEKYEFTGNAARSPEIISDGTCTPAKPEKLPTRSCFILLPSSEPYASLQHAPFHAAASSVIVSPKRPRICDGCVVAVSRVSCRVSPVSCLSLASHVSVSTPASFYFVHLHLNRGSVYCLC